MRCCYSFENRRKLFEIDSRFKFATVVAARPGPSTDFPCAFYLHDDEWLFRDERPEERRYSLDFIRRTGGEYLNLVELRSADDFAVAETCFHNGEQFGAVCEGMGIRLGRELNMTDDAFRFTPVRDVLPPGVDPRDPEAAANLLERGYLILHEGKTFHQYTDQWEDRSRYVVALAQMVTKTECLRVAPYYRLAFREIASATNERTVIFAMLPPATFGHKAPCERSPNERSSANALAVLAMMNSFAVDWVMRLRVGSSVSLFMLRSAPVPPQQQSRIFFAHAALRLSCNHAGYDGLWQEQLGCEWRETRPLHSWPVLADDHSRQDLRAAIDAAVAHAYGLTRPQYQHVLSAFSHRSYPDAPGLCLAKFDEYADIGATTFTRTYDPYWEIPLVESLPQPVIELPGVEADAEHFSRVLHQPPQETGGAGDARGKQNRPMLLDKLLSMIPPDTEERVRRTRDRYNQNVREAIRQETGLRFRPRSGVGDLQPVEFIGVPVRLMAGLPTSLRKRDVEQKWRIAALRALEAHFGATLEIEHGHSRAGVAARARHLFGGKRNAFARHRRDCVFPAQADAGIRSGQMDTGGQ